MRRGHILFALLAVTGCAGLIGVPDLTFDENAEAGRPDGASPGDGGLDGPVSTDALIDAPIMCNADLKTDKANCGACGHDCTQGLCADGLCTLMAQTQNAQALALDGDTLFIGLGGAGTFAGIASCPTKGCSSASVDPTHVTPADAGPIQIVKLALTPTHVFASDYFNSNGGGIVRVPRGGGPVERFGADPTRSEGIALDNASVYWTGRNGVWQCPIGNCAAGIQKVVDTTFAAELLLVASTGAVFYTSNHEVLRCTSKSDCVTPIALPRRTGAVLDLQRDGDTMYWSAGGEVSEVISCTVAPTVCATPTVVVPASGKDAITAIAIQGGALYWATLPYDAGSEYVNTDGIIKTCTIANCAGSTRVIATKQLAPAAIVLDDKSVYWANSGRRNFVDGIGSIVKAPR